MSIAKGLGGITPLSIHIHIHMLVSARVWRDKQIAITGALRCYQLSGWGHPDLTQSFGVDRWRCRHRVP